MRNLLILVCCFTGFIGAQAQTLKPFQQSGKFGFKSGETIAIPAQFDYVSDFQHQLALVQRDGKWGYINTSGDWAIQPVFDRAQPFNNGFAYVEKNGKVGILDTSGTFLVDAEFSNIIEDYNGFHLQNGTLKGYKYKDSTAHIPAKYANIDFHYNITVCQLPSGNYDLYHFNTLILANTPEKVTSNDINYSFRTIRVKENNRYGLLHFTKGWITDRNFAKIEEIYVPEYRIAGREYGFNRIFALHTVDFDLIDFELDNPPIDQITFIKVDGSKLSNIVFNHFESYYEEYQDAVPFDIIKARSGDKLYLMGQDLVFNETKYNSMEQHLEWYIATGVSKYYILNKYKFAVDSFDYVIRPHRQSYLVYDESTDDQLYQEMAVLEPYLIVEKGDPEMPSIAIYDLNERRIISPWINSTLNISTVRTEYGKRAYTYGLGGLMGFYIQGMQVGTEMIYQEDFFFNYFYGKKRDFHFSYVNYGSEKAELFASTALGVKNIGSFDRVFNAITWTKDTMYMDPEINEPYYTSISMFNKYFLVLKNGSKYGVLSWKGKIFEPVYDSLIDNPNPQMILTYQNGLYGSIDLEEGVEIKPFSKEPLVFLSDYLDELKPDYYVRVESENESEKCYIRSNGRKFYCHATDVNFKKIGRKYALVGYSDLNTSNDSEKTIVPPVFKKIEYIGLSNAYKAKNADKKWGIVDFAGDTLVPFIYDQIGYTDYEMSTGEIFLSTRIKKKQGVIGIRKNILIPAEYDEIKQLEFNYETHSAFLVKKENKYGVFGKNGELLLPCQYDQIQVKYTGDNADMQIVGMSGGMVTYITYADYSDVFNARPLTLYNFISGQRGFRVKGMNLEQYDLETGLLELKQDLSNAAINGTEYDISINNGKYGAVDHQGKELIAPEYDFAEFFDGRDEVMIGYQNGVKYYIYVFTKERYTEEQW